MKTVSVELDSDTANVLLNLLKERRANAAERIRQLDAQIARIEGTVVSADTASLSQAEEIDIATLTPTGRIRRGHTKPAVLKFLSSCNGNAATIKEISRATGTEYPTVHAVLKQLAKENRVVVGSDSKWRVKS